jgi:hypothetical protein
MERLGSLTAIYIMRDLFPYYSHFPQYDTSTWFSSPSYVLLQNLCPRILQYDGKIRRHSRTMGRRLPARPGQFLPASLCQFHLLPRSFPTCEPRSVPTCPTRSVPTCQPSHFLPASLDQFVPARPGHFLHTRPRHFLPAKAAKAAKAAKPVPTFQPGSSYLPARSVPTCQYLSVPTCQFVSFPICQSVSVSTCRTKPVPTCQFRSVATCRPGLRRFQVLPNCRGGFYLRSSTYKYPVCVCLTK